MSVLNNIGGVVLKPIIKEMSRARLPKIDGQVFLKGLKEEVEIIRDEWGVAHIYANNMRGIDSKIGRADIGKRLDDGHTPSSSRPISMRLISLVPAPISNSLASRMNRSTGQSLV